MSDLDFKYSILMNCLKVEILMRTCEAAVECVIRDFPMQQRPIDVAFSCGCYILAEKGRAPRV